MFNPCPEDHIDSALIELVIDASKVLMEDRREWSSGDKCCDRRRICVAPGAACVSSK